MPRLLVHLSGEQDPRRKAKTSSRSRVLLLDAEGAEHDRGQEAPELAFAVSPPTPIPAEATPDSTSAVLARSDASIIEVDRKWVARARQHGASNPASHLRPASLQGHGCAGQAA